MSDVAQDLEVLKAKVKTLERLKAQNEIQLKNLEVEQEKIVAEATALGIPPGPGKIEEVLKAEEAAVQAEVAALDAELSKALEQVNAL
jgi:hypothetical protein